MNFESKSRGSTRTPSAFAVRLEALHADQAAFEDSGDRALALAAEAGRPGGDPEVACRAYRYAIKPFADRQRWMRAVFAVSRGVALARARGLPAHVAGFTLQQALLKGYMGDHAGGVHELVRLASDKLAAHLTLADRLALFTALSRWCLMVDPDDSVECCLRLGATALAQSGVEPTSHHWAAQVVAARLAQFLHSGPAFHGLLRRPNLSEPRRAAILAEAGEALRTARRRSDLLPAEAEHLEIGSLLIEALASRTCEPAYRVLSLPLMRDVPPSVESECRYDVAAVALTLGDAPLAARVMGEARDPAGRQAVWDVRLYWLYLRSAVAEALGDTARSLALYREYVEAVSEQMARMDLRVRQALHELTRLPGARPEDTPDVMPRYLSRATELLHSEPLAFDVAGLAAAVGVSERTLRSAFRIHHGKPPKAYIMDIRLDAARKFVESTGNLRPTVTELAERFGFSHPGRFAAAYRARFGRSPGS